MNNPEQLHILLVEDNPDFRKSMNWLLTSRGYKVTTAENGNAAWSILKSSGQEFDVAIVDFEMPEMNGATFIRKLVESQFAQRLRLVVLFTGYSDTHQDKPIAELTAEVQEKIPFRYVHKLMPSKDLLTIIESARTALKKV